MNCLAEGEAPGGSLSFLSVESYRTATGAGGRGMFEVWAVAASLHPSIFTHRLAVIFADQVCIAPVGQPTQLPCRSWRRWLMVSSGYVPGPVQLRWEAARVGGLTFESHTGAGGFVFPHVRGLATASR